MSNRIGWMNRASRASSIRLRGLAVSAGLLFAFMTSGFASADTGINGVEEAIQIDIFILATDRVTADEVLGRLQGVEKLSGQQPGQTTWSRGQLTGTRDGSVYSIVVAQVDAQNHMTTKRIMQNADMAWRPRYVLILGTAPAVPYDEPLGAVGIVTLVCGFDLDRYEKSQDPGKCHRADGGLFTAALSIAEEWQVAAGKKTSRAGCSPARVLKLTTLSSTQELGPGFLAVATKLSEDLHRGLIMERDSIFVAQAVQNHRYDRRETIGFLMIRGVSDIRTSGRHREDDPEANEPEQRRLQETCAAHDTADFAVELIRERWPVSSKASR